MRLSEEDARKAVNTIVENRWLTEDYGTPGVIVGPAKDGFGSDLAIWFITHDQDRGIMFPITRDQAYQFVESLKKAIDINKGLARK